MASATAEETNALLSPTVVAVQHVTHLAGIGVDGGRLK